MAPSARSRPASCLTRLALTMLFAGASFGAAPTIALAQVDFKSGLAPAPTKMDSGTLQASLSGLAGRIGSRRALVQFSRPVSDAERADLQLAGMTLQTYVGSNSFFATLDGAGLKTAGLAANTALLRADAVQTTWKLHPELVEGLFRPFNIVEPIDESVFKVPESGATLEALLGAGLDPEVALYVMFHPDVDAATDGNAAVIRNGGTVRGVMSTINAAVVHIRASLVVQLANEDGVLWVEPPIPKMSETNDSNRARVGADTVQAAPYSLNGAGVTVLVYDGGKMFVTHPTFGGRAIVGASDTSGTIDHATHVGGTIGGSGAGSPGNLRKGMAPGVNFVSFGLEQAGGLHQGFLYTDPCDIEDDYNEAINIYGADIANNSIGTNTAPNGYPCEWEGNYGVTDVLIDNIVRGSLGTPFRICWANGNERGSGRCGSTYHTTAPPACAKNHVTLGAMNSNDDSVTGFTSWGPSDDDRMKPDVSAPGCQSNDDQGVTSSTGSGGYDSYCGTSMASPTACGVASLLLQDYRANYPTRPDFRNSTLKTFLAHSAVDLETVGPDYKTGYGSIRAPAVVDLMRSGNFAEGQVAQGQSHFAVVVVNPGDTQLKVSLAWDDFPGTPVVSPALVNDLDLIVTSPSGVRAFPWTLGGNANPSAAAVRTQEDHINNIEQVVVSNPQVGGWTIEVRGTNVPQGPQPFSIVGTPYYVNCSSRGLAFLADSLYSCASAPTIRVVDCDLNTSNAVVDTVQVLVFSNSEPAGELVTLTETAAQSATFTGTAQLGSTNSVGTLLVTHGDTLTMRYVDANDGIGGTNVHVEDTATIDCVPSVITGVVISNIQAHSATLQFSTDTPARPGARLGTSCGSLSTVVESDVRGTTHTINLTGLAESTGYSLAATATDDAGNQSTNNNGGSCYTFGTPSVPDFFTEQFTTDFDLANKKLTFHPAISEDWYTLCVETIDQLPTDPTGGTALPLSNNNYALIALSDGARVLVYGVLYGQVFVGANGYVNFWFGQSTSTETLLSHFAQARIAALFDDLNPGPGQVSWRQLSDRLAVTWSGVPEAPNVGSNTMQIEMFFDGRITISYLDMTAQDGIVGLSRGLGLDPAFEPNDLSSFAACPTPPTANNVAASTTANTPVLVALSATDDGQPGPLSYSIVTLPASGSLSDPNGGSIAAVPYTLLSGGNTVRFTPPPAFQGQATFQYRASDGGSPPSGGNSNTATATVTVTGCPADFNNSGAVTSQDIFDFLAAFFTPGSLAADFNNSGAVTSQDIFDFLAAFFTPCP